MRIFRPGHNRLAIALITLVFTSMTLPPSYTQTLKHDPGKAATADKATVAEAEKFIADAEKQLFALSVKTSRADWVKSTYITDDTETLSAEANRDLIAVTTELAEKSRRFDGLPLSPEVARKIKLLKLSLTLPAPANEAERDELT